jgi:hypothetical protein
LVGGVRSHRRTSIEGRGRSRTLVDSTRTDDPAGALPSGANPELEDGGGESDVSLDSGGPARGFRLPAPTWSVSDLQLNADHDPISYEELHQLCRRACLLPPPPQEDASRRLAQDVGNLIHLIEQVRSIDPDQLLAVGDDAPSDSSVASPTIPSWSSPSSPLSHRDASERARLIYDAPRGVSSTPLGGCREDGGDRPNASAAAQEDLADSSRVRESLLRPKMAAVGGHYYFTVQTGEASSKTSTSTKSKDALRR